MTDVMETMSYLLLNHGQKKFTILVNVSLIIVWLRKV